MFARRNKSSILPLQHPSHQSQALGDIDRLHRKIISITYPPQTFIKYGIQTSHSSVNKSPSCAGRKNTTFNEREVPHVVQNSGGRAIGTSSSVVQASKKRLWPAPCRVPPGLRYSGSTRNWKVICVWVGECCVAAITSTDSIHLR